VLNLETLGELDRQRKAARRGGNGKATHKANNGKPAAADVVDRARAYVAKMDPAIEGQGGSDATMSVAVALLRGFELSDAQARRILTDDYNPRCKPEWSADELDHKIDSARNGNDESPPFGYLKDKPLPERPAIHVEGDFDSELPPVEAYERDDARPAIRGTKRKCPEIQIGADVQEMADAAIDALAGVEDLYQRDGGLVRLVRVAQQEADARLLEGTPIVRDLPTATLTEMLSTRATWLRHDRRADEWRRTTPHAQAVAAVAARGAWATVRPVRGIIESPIMRPDGTLVTKPGYDSATGFVYAPTCEFPAVPVRPSKDEANAALLSLREPWAEFPFVSDVHRDVPLALALTLLVRPAIEGPTPATIFDASTPGEGKTLGADVAVALATGRPAGKATFPGKVDELEKMLVAAALDGSATLMFDNVDSDVAFGGAPLNKALTAWPCVSFRVLGHSEWRSMAWNAAIVATGNNVEVRGDAIRRCLITRVESGTEHPEQRAGYQHPGVLPWLKTVRPKLVVDGLTLVRAYCVAGRPNMQLGNWGTFEAWTGLVASALVWAGGANVLDAQAVAQGVEDSSKSALRTILLELPRLAAEPIAVRTIISTLWSRERLRGVDKDGKPVPPDGFDALRGAFESLAPPTLGQPPDGHKLGKALQTLRRRVVGGLRLDAVNQGDRKAWVVR
jgi:hypothetical protein